VLIDDMVDTAGTLCQAAQPSKMRAIRVVAYITIPCSRGGDRAHREIGADELW